MKTESAIIIAKKYAQACINSFLDILSLEDFYNIVAAERYLRKRSRIFFFLRLSAIDDVIKLQGLEHISQQFKLGKPINKVIMLLLAHKRTFLFADVLYFIAELYKERRQIISFTFIGAHQLSVTDQECFKRFLIKQTGYDIIYKSTVDKELIAGIRLLSNTLLWEHSVRKQLHNMRLQFI